MHTSNRGGEGGRRPVGRLSCLILVLSPLLFGFSLAQDGTCPCAAGFCCSTAGYCGTSDAYCAPGNCASQCPSTSPSPPSTPSSSGVGSIVTSSLYDSIFPSRNSFYTYDSFITASALFSAFGTTGSSTQQKQDIAAFLAHVYHETAGLLYIDETNQSDYCDQSNTQYPCAANQQYYGRGPLQISWNYNYGACGQAIGQDLLGNPGLVATDPNVSWESAMWFWTTAQPPKPSCEAVMDGSWSPSSDDISRGISPAGFGVTIDIINGGIECGPSAQHPEQAADRVNQYQNICGLLGVDPGNGLDCTNMQPF